MLRILAPALAVALVVSASPGAIPLASQEIGPAASGTVLSEEEARRVVRRARSEQARFERIRRNHLPWTWGGGGGECDERIGRFCLTHTDRGSEWKPEPEPDETRQARERLIEELDRAARLLPDEPWIVGQRVRYLVEAGRMAEATRAARECRTEAWWCAALRGFAHHNAGEPAPADAAFAMMLGAMPEQERDRWTDLSVLLDDCTRREYRRLDARGRDRFEERFWHLADPFQTRPGNELRSEHFSRNVWDQLQDRAKSTEGIPWGDDLREILLRYGWPRGWERTRERYLGDTPGLVSHYDGSDLDLLPPCEALRPDGGVELGEWDAIPRAPRTSYALPMPDSAIEWHERLDHQLAVFRRGDSAVIVAAYEMPADSLPAGARVEAGLAVARSAAESPHVTGFPDGGLSDVLAVRAPAGDMLLSLEVLALEARRAARARYGLTVPAVVPGLLAVSDLLLLRSPDALPDSLAPAVTRARSSVRLRQGERVGVYWELYGLSPQHPDEITIQLRLVQEGAGWLRRLARRIGLVERVPPVRVRWRETPGGQQVLARSLAVQIPPELEPGEYAIELSVTVPGREPLIVKRQVVVQP